MPAAVQTYRLCQRCSERQGATAPVLEVVEGKQCFICGGMTERVGKIAEKAVSRAKRYQFKTFAVGVTVPEGVQEREDELRSNLKLKGNETIKTQVARLVSSRLAATMGKRLDKQRPDVTLLADFSADDVLVTSRPVFFYGKYTKPAGISQRRLLCEACRGTGCKKCGNSGFERKASVEALIRRKLTGFSGSEKMTFTWLGSEDVESMVYPPGRPFVVEVKNPMKRRFPKKFGARFKGGRVTVTSGRVLASKPLHLPAFRFETRIRAVSRKKVGADELASLRSRFRRATVRFERPHNRPTMKTVYSVSAVARGRTLLIDAQLDGGLPVKRFVSGELVSPSVSEVLKTEVSCRSFDICGVREKGEFGFAEITRNKEKD